MPPIVITVLNILSLLTAATPAVEKIYAEARKLFKMWFDGGIITVEQQAFIMKWSGDHEKAVLAGEVPPELQIEPDPAPKTPTPTPAATPTPTAP